MNPTKIIRSAHPIHKVLLSFVALILAGALLLWLPFSSRHGISFIDALFTATSAVCVTGLTVLDTSKDFTLAGQAVILALIQLGGLGIMTFSIALIALIGGSFSIKWRFTMESIYSGSISFPVKSILKRIILYTFSVELVIAAIMFPRFFRGHDLPTAAWHAIFHSISSFCNAGFSTFPDSLIGYRGDAAVLLASAAAIIMGGLGFVVMTEIFNARSRIRRGMFRHFSLHTRIVLVATAVLIVGGTAVILALEWERLFSGFGIGEKLLTGFYQSVTCRTAGFNTVEIGALREGTLLFMIFLMFVGGSPGSIAGGVKTSTFAVILGLIAARVRGRRQVTFAGRSVSGDTVDRSVTLVLLAWFFICAASFLLMVLNGSDMRRPFLDAIFEITSAFGTVGLSTGITPSLEDPGKLLLILVMYAGRLGPLTLITALTAAKKEFPVDYAEEHIMIG